VEDKNKDKKDNKRKKLEERAEGGMTYLSETLGRS
jgi:hypothetical protein